MTTRIGDLARHTGVYGVGTVVGGIGRAALVPIIARYVPTEEYGKASVVFIFITLLAIGSELGLSSSLIKFVNEASLEERRRKIVSTVLLASLLLSVPIAIACYLLADQLSHVLLGSARYRTLMLIGVAGGVGNALLQVGLSFERALARSLRYVAYTLIKGGLALALSIVLVVILRRGAVGLLVGTALPPIAIGVVIYAHLIRRFRAVFSRRIFRSVFAFGSPLVPMNLAMWVLAYSDIYLLRRLASSAGALSEVGLYQYAHEICLVLVLPITSLNLAWPQFIFSNYAKPGAKLTFSRVHLYFTFFLVEIGFLISVFSRQIIRFVGSAQYAGSADVIPLLAGSLVFYGFSIVFSSGLYVAAKTRILAMLVGASAALNVVLNIAMIPAMGKQGAALATLATNLVMAVLVLAFSQAHYEIPFRLKQTFGAAVLAGAVLGALAYLSGRGSGGGVLVRLVVTLGFSVALIVLLRIGLRDLTRALSTVASMMRPTSRPRSPEHPAP